MAWNRKSGIRAVCSPLRNWPAAPCWLLVARWFTAMVPPCTMSEIDTVPISSQPRFWVSSAHGACGPGLEQAVLPPQRGGHAEERGDGHQDAPRPGGGDADHAEDDRQPDAGDAVGAEEQPVVAEPLVRRQRAPGQVADAKPPRPTTSATVSTCCWWK